MISRREGLTLALGAAVSTAGVTRAFAQAAPNTVKTPPGFDPPAGSCDSHVHVFPDPAAFPFTEKRVYSPPVATAADLLALQKAMRFDRVVIVQPSVYGTDNRATLDGIKMLGPARARGVAVIGPATTKEDLDAMAAGGIRGVRANLETGGVTDPAAAAKILETAVKQIEGRGWHLQIYASLPLVTKLKTELGQVPVPVVFDHFAGADAAKGVEQPGFDSVLELIKSGRAYMKISGAYRASRTGAPDYPQVVPFAKALVAANPDRIVWGSDWPHPDSYPVAGRKPTDLAPALDIDTGRLLGLVAEWVPDAATRTKILVDNPARLYGF